jgi:organic hydroperoxide reductase OsmC/OhrA
MADERTHHVTLSRARDFEFIAEFSDAGKPVSMLLDEPPPLGGGHGPNAAELLGASVGNCLAASLTFCLKKIRVNPEGLTAEVTTHVGRNADGKLRITGIDVELSPEVAASDAARLDRCEQLFEDFCLVTQSVRCGIPVNVTVNEAAKIST